MSEPEGSRNSTAIRPLQENQAASNHNRSHRLCVMTCVALECPYRWGLQDSNYITLYEGQNPTVQSVFNRLKEVGRGGGEEWWVAEHVSPPLIRERAAKSWHILLCSNPSKSGAANWGQWFPEGVLAGATLVRIRNAWPHDWASC